MTALVGPNGSGKTNVVDAIRWCLGEQSMRDLRSQRAEDVIYAGPRLALGAAEVTLAFADSGPGTGGSGDTAVARRLLRSGESEYLLDGRKVRLRDVQDALRRLGVDGSRHIVVTQGMADALLAATPGERRSLLEAAAGLSGYRTRRDEARQKLATTESNIATIEMVLAELEPRLRTLRRQARAVLERDEARAQLRLRLSEWYAARWQVTLKRQEELRAEAARLLLCRQTAERRVSELEEAAERALESERQWRQRLDMVTTALHAAERERDGASRRRAQAEQHLQSLEQQLSAARARRERLALAVAGAASRAAEIETSRGETAAQVAELEHRLAGVSARLAGEIEAGREVENEVRLREEEAVREERKVGTLERRLETLRHSRDGADRNAAQLERWLESARASVEGMEREVAEIAAEIDAGRRRLEAAERQLHELEEGAATLRERSVRLDSVLGRVRAALGVCRHRAEATSRALGGFGSEMQGTLLDAVTLRPGWEAAVAAALGAWSYASRTGRMGTRLHGDPADGVLAWRAGLGDLTRAGIWADSVVEGMPSGFVNPLLTTLLVETEGEAEEMWRAVKDLPADRIGSPPLQIVTRGGERWSASGVESAGSGDRAGEYLRLKREAAALRRRAGVLSARVDRMMQARSALERERSQADVGVRRAHGDVRQLRHESADLAERQAAIARRRSELQDQIAQRDGEARSLAEEIQRAAEEEASASSELVRLRESAEAARRKLGDERARLDVHRGAVEQLSKERQDADRGLEVARVRLRAGTELGSSLAAERERLTAELNATEVERAGLREGIERARADIGTLTAHEHELAELVRGHEARLNGAKQERPTGTGNADDLRAVRRAASEGVSAHEAAQAQLTQVVETGRELRREIHEELGSGPEELSGPPDDIPSEADIRKLRARAGQYADADASVVDEARELAERQRYLSQHVEDLRSAGDTLREMMQVADGEMRSQFDVALTAVSEEFGRVFEVMLRGGGARLEQIDDAGGIEVVAHLPGKRHRSSASFSGGERALVASSLLFGVLRIRPAPFCVLDEVDAALDESNVDRYLAALRDITKETQVIVVTHNRATMAAADVLYGLTMDAEGASNILSIRLDSRAAG